MIRLICIICLSISFSANLCAQKNTILPLTGIRSFSEGIQAKNIVVTVDGSNLLNNKVPLNKEIEIKLQLPTGFTLAGGNYFAGAQVNILAGNGAVLSKNPNVFSANSTGFAAAAFKEVIVKTALRPEIIKAEANVTLQVRFFDLKSKNQLRLEFPITIARPGEAAQVSKLAAFVKTSDGSVAITTGLRIKNIDVQTDTSIRVNPKMIYLSFDIPGIQGTSLDDVLNGTETFWIYDANLTNVKTADKLLKKVNSSMESTIVNYTLKIPMRLKSLLVKGYTVRFRWESKDHFKILDIVSVK